MKIGILGSGIVAQVLGKRWIELEHDVMLGTRDPAKLDDKKNMAGSLRDWLESVGGKGKIGTFAQTAQHGEVLVNATNGVASLDALRLTGAENMKGKALIDVANALDFSMGMPPALAIKEGDSLGAEIQRAFPDVKVVKTLNTMNCYVMVDPQRAGGGDHTVFLSGNDSDAKAQVAELLAGFGWTDILDLGDISTSRGVELTLPLWLNISEVTGYAPFNFKVAR